MKKTIWIAACMAALLALLVIGCENDSAPVAVENVALNTTTLTLVPVKTERLTATVTPSNADDKTVTWQSADTSVATVGNDGTVTAVKAGTATITAQADDRTAECMVTVHVHSYSSGKCTVCGAVPYMENGTIDDYGTLTKYSGTDAVVVIPDGVTKIWFNVFDGCEGLKSVVIPDSVTYIGSDAFQNCTSLTSVKIGDGVTEIGINAFRNCTSLTSVVIPDGVTEIGWTAFEG